MIVREITVAHEEGLKARTAAHFVQLANKFGSNILIEKDTKKVSAKSIMGIMALGLSNGTKIKMVVTGPDEENAIEDLVNFFERNKE